MSVFFYKLSCFTFEAAFLGALSRFADFLKFGLAMNLRFKTLVKLIQILNAPLGCFLLLSCIFKRFLLTLCYLLRKDLLFLGTGLGSLAVLKQTIVWINISQHLVHHKILNCWLFRKDLGSWCCFGAIWEGRWAESCLCLLFWNLNSFRLWFLLLRRVVLVGYNLSFLGWCFCGLGTRTASGVGSDRHLLLAHLN